MNCSDEPGDQGPLDRIGALQHEIPGNEVLQADERDLEVRLGVAVDVA